MKTPALIVLGIVIGMVLLIVAVFVYLFRNPPIR